MKFKYICIFTLVIGFLSCEENESPIPEEVLLPELTSGSANFSNYVSIGASFTSGFTDGALFEAGQQNSFPNILAKEFAKVGGGSFTQPLMKDNTGGMVFGAIPVAAYRLIFNGSAPQRLNEFLEGLGAPAPPITTDASVNLANTFNNIGVPGAKSFHVTFPGYGSLNPYFGRMASSASATMLSDALSQKPTFFTLSELGGNDVLSYATSGGIGVDQKDNLDPTSYGSNDITDPNVFASVLNEIVSALSETAKGVVANVPYITDLPYFTFVKNDALVLDESTAGQLTKVFEAVSGLFLQSVISQGLPLGEAQALAAQYAITFSEGPNRWIIDVPVSDTNPLGFRQMTDNELLLLTIDRNAIETQGYGTVALTPDVLQVLDILNTGGTPTAQQAGLVIAAVNGIDDKDALDTDELSSIKEATDAYNTTIAAIANTNENVALLDLNSILTEVASTGIDFDGFNLTSELVTGGAVSLDGIHLNAKGYAFMANKFLEVIDANFGSNFFASGNVARASNFSTTYSAQLP